MSCSVEAVNFFLSGDSDFDVPASLDIATSNFGQITSMQTKDNAGPRAISLTARLSF
ncbi:MAG: hypothetical protein PW789_04005 [Edaphobacter sp.]|uniref:hypothetical protein n=1 Tax=Edaphobacter sp. TaxID=1934404 RepID=UPI00238954E3|nr:hypothetical protein [Edaphobacter sp.]MDE1175749.1 hypothetical protein [Edaphobacter sp.]